MAYCPPDKVLTQISVAIHTLKIIRNTNGAKIAPNTKAPGR
jgi:hypothetical protein